MEYNSGSNRASNFKLADHAPNEDNLKSGEQFPLNCMTNHPVANITYLLQNARYARGTNHIGAFCYRYDHNEVSVVARCPQDKS